MDNLRLLYCRLVAHMILCLQLPDIMANTGLLFASNVAKVPNILVKASQYVKKILYIKVNSSSDNVISQHISNVYSQATSQCSNLDVRLILKTVESADTNTNHPVDVIFYDETLSANIDKLKKSVANIKNIENWQAVELQEAQTTEAAPSVTKYEYVALGGTFDRLHNGHKILLSHAALRASKHLTVGVTDINMIHSKKLWELIEPVEKRVKSVLEFLTDINPGIEYNVLPIQDIYGPTKDDPRYQLLVVSEETVRGGVKVNEKRREAGLNELAQYVVALAQDTGRGGHEEDKVSSSNQRMRLLGTLLKQPEPNPNIPPSPYVIGLAGGIASGKSHIAKWLQVKGAGIVDCDIIAHDLYKPGLPLNGTLAEAFGRDIITETGEVDRRLLGSIVFGDKTQLEKLNSIVWPAVLAEARRRVIALGDAGYKVVVMEAAVMVRAKWYTSCHQLWSVIIPPEEAVKRLQQRNNLTEEEARQRIASQPTNLEQVAPANVVFSPFWELEHTQAQVDRAWSQLQALLNSSAL